jgi:limonene-1,2-epoxide hydrolase
LAGLVINGRATIVRAGLNLNQEAEMKNDIALSVERFVKALDRNNFEEAGRSLSPRCRYSIRQTELTGPEAILKSYAENAQWAEETLERIVYESEIAQTAADTFEVLFIDRIFHQGLEHTYRTKQILTVNDEGEIERILNEDIPGEREAVTEFLEKLGIKRS